ncbi:Beta-lactamase [Roseovarius sp. THAF8]|uniref:beta-lactamase n=1 Tax=Roseovarius sp. THAF8 TaxID=2587846 RepID=UPI0012AA1DCA|nr:beta-lactamase [Roseovarius sp. THAF8]QFT96602.1 Beta-lactamase [Roseovarius sp. THAF8]
MMKKLMGAFVAVLACGAAVAEESDIDALAARHFGPLMETHDIPGIALGITHGGDSQFFTIGLAARDDGVAVTPDTLFELGSISKLFTATQAALMEVRGELDLDDPVSAYIEPLKGSAFGALSLADLATHHSGGLPLQVPDGVSDIDALISWLKDWALSMRGARSYSNISIGLLGHIESRIADRSYAELMEQGLFAEMGLRDTFVDVPEAVMPRYAYGVDRDTGEAIRVGPGVLGDEAYGVKSSARDLVRLLDLYLGHAQAGDDLTQALARTREGFGTTEAYVQNLIWEEYPWPVDADRMVRGNSYDFILEPQPMERITPARAPGQDVILNKTGATFGFGAYVVLLPAQDLGVVYLANRNIPNEARVRAMHGFVTDLLEGQ